MCSGRDGNTGKNVLVVVCDCSAGSGRRWDTDERGMA